MHSCPHLRSRCVCSWSCFLVRLAVPFMSCSAFSLQTSRSSRIPRPPLDKSSGMSRTRRKEAVAASALQLLAACSIMFARVYSAFTHPPLSSYLLLMASHFALLASIFLHSHADKMFSRHLSEQGHGKLRVCLCLCPSEHVVARPRRRRRAQRTGKNKCRQAVARDKRQDRNGWGHGANSLCTQSVLI